MNASCGAKMTMKIKKIPVELSTGILHRNSVETGQKNAEFFQGFSINKIRVLPKKYR